MYLTFDDGPSQNTDRILKILKKYNAKATFFVTGCHQEYNQYIIEAYKQGHTIGLHSYLHEYQDIYSSKDAYFKDLKKIKQMVKQLIGIQVHYIRFPGGSSNRISKNYCHGVRSQLHVKSLNKVINIMTGMVIQQMQVAIISQLQQSLNKLQVKHIKILSF